MRCLCFSQKTYSNCCRPFHEGDKPKTCEQLMRSRYSAYALGLVDYIVQTTHSKSRQADIATWGEEIGAFCKQTEFTGLTIEEATEDTVTFYAQLRRGNMDVSFREKSSFTTESGRLVYVEGVINR